MTNSTEAQAKGRGSVERSLRRIAERLQGSEVLKDGTVVLRLRGPEGGDYEFDSRARKIELRAQGAVAADRRPLLEIFGDAETVRAIIDGERDAAEQFFEGGIRVRGDLQFFSDVALELGLLERPL